MPFFLGKNSRDPDTWEWYVHSCGRLFVWVSVHVDCLGDAMPEAGTWPFDSDVECVIVPKEEYDKLVSAQDS